MSVLMRKVGEWHSPSEFGRTVLHQCPRCKDVLMSKATVTDVPVYCLKCD